MTADVFFSRGGDIVTADVFFSRGGDIVTGFEDRSGVPGSAMAP